MTSRTVRRLGAAALLLWCSLPAVAQQWPSKPIRIVVANAPGAVTDVVARLYAELLARSVGQPVVIDNRPGADGLIGATAAARSAPDGYTYYVASQSFIAIDPHIHAAPPVDPAKDFVPVAVLIDTTPMAIAVNSAVPASNVQELVALAKSQPGKLSYGVTVPILGMVGQWLSKRAGIDMVEVSYKATAQQVADNVSGVIPISISTLGTFEPMAKAGKLRVIAVTSPVRIPGWENVPSIMETYPDMDLGGGLVLLAPAGTPAAIIERVNRETVGIVGSSDYRDRIRPFAWANLKGARTTGGTAEYMKTERERWGKILRELGIKPK
jgi:tripartite-type tricarboxylate transporter receptor subunit TctC